MHVQIKWAGLVFPLDVTGKFANGETESWRDYRAQRVGLHRRRCPISWSWWRGRKRRLGLRALYPPKASARAPGPYTLKERQDHHGDARKTLQMCRTLSGIFYVACLAWRKTRKTKRIPFWVPLKNISGLMPTRLTCSSRFDNCGAVSKSVVNEVFNLPRVRAGHNYFRRANAIRRARSHVGSLIHKRPGCRRDEKVGSSSGRYL